MKSGILSALTGLKSLWSGNERSRRGASRRWQRSRFLQVEGLEDRSLLATLYVDDSFQINTDTGPTGLSAGDTVTFRAGAGSGHTASTVGSLNFGTQAFTSIQAAVNAAAAGDTIVVGSGTFAEGVTVNKSLTLLGNQVGVDAQSFARVGARESIVTGTGNSGITPFYVTANNVTINGFSVQGATSPNQFGFGIVLGANTSGHTVTNNVITGNVVGIGLGSDNTTISNNLIVSNNVAGPAGGTGIYSDQFVAGGALTNVTINNNTISGNNNAAIVIGPSDAAQAADNITISNNIMSSNGSGVVLINATNSRITGNEIVFSEDAAINLAGGNNNVTITNNLITGGDAQGILIDQTTFFATTANTNVTINRNSITANAGAGLEVAPSAYTGTLNAELNWWGSATGPTNVGNPGGIGQAVIGANIDFLPFLTVGTDADLNLRGFQVQIVNADLAVTKTAAATVAPGGNLTYTIVVKNNSTTSAAANLSLTETLPAGVTIVNVQAPGGWSTTSTTSPLVFTTASLAANAQASFTITVKVDESVAVGTALTNSVNVAATTGDTNLLNNVATTITNVIDAAEDLVCEVTTANLPGMARSATIQADLDASGTVLVVTGTSGNDTITVDKLSGNRVRVRMSGFERVFNQNVAAETFDRIVVFGQAGNDRITISSSITADAIIMAGAGNDTVTGGGGNDAIDGEDGNDTLSGGNGNDVICGGRGNDNVNGGNGDDKLGGDDGNDRIRGDAGNDLLLGNVGNDNLDGGTGDDRLFGQQGNDSLLGQAGNDLLIGGEGQDKLEGGAGLDIVIGGAGADQIKAGASNDIVIGASTSGDENLVTLQAALDAWVSGSSTRHDTIRGLLGDITDDNAVDSLFGEAGDDWFLAGARDSLRDRGRSELLNLV